MTRMPAALLSKNEVIERLTQVFRELTYDSASLSELSKATGLGKSSLYHYFPGGKEDMGRAVLENSVELLQGLLAMLQGGSTPETRLRKLIKALGEFYGGGRRACLLGNLSSGSARQVFQNELRMAFTTWIDAIAQFLAEAGVPASKARERAEEAVLQVQGALILSAGLDTTEPFQRLMRRLPGQLLKN